MVSQYIPSLGDGSGSREELIAEYFRLGFDNNEILCFLLLYHGIKLSLRHLKRILSKKGLYRRQNYSNVQDVVSVVESELASSGSSLGYRQMHQRLKLNYGLTVSRETVRIILRTLDPEGVQERSRNKLKRRQYRSRGPNYIWHIDGYDKLKPYGFCIHGAIDGYSRRILWLEVGPSNNDPCIIAKYYCENIKQLGGCPHICRGDRGTENVHVAGIQRFLRRDDIDVFSGEKSFLYGRSVSNQRIECWWSQFRKTETNWWRRYFRQLKNQGLFDDSNPLHVECLRFCYMPLLKKELALVLQQWNLHKIRPSTNEYSPHGRPDTIYFIPEAFDSRSYLHQVCDLDLKVAEDVCCNVSEDRFAKTFSELAHLIATEKHLQLPSQDVQHAESLYIDLLAAILDT